MWGLQSEEIWVIATCLVCGIACAIPGVFLMLSRASLLADGIAHATLAGIGLSFLLFNSRNPFLLLSGAFLSGIATIVLVVFIQRVRVIRSDTALGIVFTTLFAIGVVIVSTVAHDVDLDPGCVLYGLAEFVAFDTVRVGSVDVPTAFLSLSGILIFNVLFAWLCWKELVITIFDPAQAALQSMRPALIRLIFLLSVTATIVLSFEIVGSLLVVSVLIAPAITAHMLTHSLVRIVLLASFFAALSAPIGYSVALSTNTSVAGSISIALGILCTLAIVGSPRRGILAVALQKTLLRLRIIEDDILGILFRWHEASAEHIAPPISIHFLVQVLRPWYLIRIALMRLKTRGAILTASDKTLRLTEQGLVEAKALIRSHRLWESYLAKHLELPPDHLHEPSERTEHYIGRALARDIEHEVGAKTDPHGRTIPK
jgi:manganese/zinc/iron transport system permease protein